jgi:hypothetical protein
MGETMIYAEDWAWNSYCYYEFGDESVLKMDWDGN